MNCISSIDNRPIHLNLPIAPQANHSLGAVTDEKKVRAMMPMEAVSWVRELRKGGKIIKSIELAGPGDSVASFQASFTTLELLQPEIGEAELSMTCLGLGAAVHAEGLKRSGVTKVNLLVDTIDTETAENLYVWIRPGKRTIPLSQAAPILVTEQEEAVKALSALGITVVIRTTVYKGINEKEVGLIAEKMADLGAAEMELDVESADSSLVESASAYLPTTPARKESDLLPPGMPQAGQDVSLPKPSEAKINVAVASSNGMDVDMHLGQAPQLLIYGPREDGLACLLETRETPPSGAPGRWQALADTLHDCFALLASHAGEKPLKELFERDISVILTEENVEGAVDVLFGGGKKGKGKKKYSSAR